MKLSILLPTRNGGSQLEGCVRSVLGEPDDELELVVSDNASDDRTPEILAAFADDPRLRATRQPEPLSVTENWQRTLEAATGDYLMLLGDDDLLLPGAIARLRALIDAHDAPEVVSFEAYGFAFPDALDEGSPAYYSDPLFPYEPKLAEGTLSPERRLRFVRDFFDFDITFCPNLQTTLASRAVMERLRNGAFREPYPDFYLVNALLLIARSWVHTPDKLTVVGISPKSFGRTLKGGGTDAGRAYLGIDTSFPGYLPGSDMNNGSHLFLQRLAEDYRPELGDTEISRSKYVYRQGYAWYLAFRLGEIDWRELGRRLRMLSGGDWLGFARELGARIGPEMVRRHAKVDESSAIASVWPNMRPIPDVRGIEEFGRWVSGAEPVEA
jgi:glycosyltransferase involved in cell wall biosynthesis